VELFLTLVLFDKPFHEGIHIKALHY
jgi:hypothetical protein